MVIGCASDGEKGALVSPGRLWSTGELRGSPIVREREEGFSKLRWLLVAYPLIYAGSVR